MTLKPASSSKPIADPAMMLAAGWAASSPLYWLSCRPYFLMAVNAMCGTEEQPRLEYAANEHPANLCFAQSDAYYNLIHHAFKNFPTSHTSFLAVAHRPESGGHGASALLDQPSITARPR
jgi:hypothetical protein